MIKTFEAIRWEYSLFRELLKSFPLHGLLADPKERRLFRYYLEYRHRLSNRIDNVLTGINVGSILSEAPKQFQLKVGAELGYHLHIYDQRGNDTGWVATRVGEKVYVERHRVGKVKAGYNLENLGSNAKSLLRECILDNLMKFPDSACRNPSIDPNTGKGKAMQL